GGTLRTLFSRDYVDKVAVTGVTMSLEPGELVGYIGPNGAGKSTTINMLCTLARPTSGHARVAGFDVADRPKAVRRHIGLVFQEQTLDEQLTANENLRFHAVLYRVPRREVDARIEHVLLLVGLQGRGDDLVSTFSGGMARRLEIARALLHTPEVLFLDEPTIGLDPQTRALMWEDVLRMRDEEGVTVFLTTHYMDEAEYANRIAIIDYGHIVALDTPANLKARIGADRVELQTANDKAALAALARAGYDVRPTETGMTVSIADGEGAVAPLIEAVAPTPVRHVHVHQPTLDDVFLSYTGREIREQAGQGGTTMQRAWRARHR
ncbi:MAG TPA: ATP-binding cassette domain-containing protein, partial [Acidimicrobiia bacterium]|nr:ATP-binding cassette domain-containing protein [Acidimicrobiia bacterium]